MSKNTTYVGLDVHKETIVGAILLPLKKQAVAVRLANEDGAVRRFVRKLKRQAPGPIECCYEAGPTGFYLKRFFEGLGVHCVVVAPSLIPAKPGDRIKTDQRDARKLAELYRAKLLTEVSLPSEEEEAVRDLCRAREDATQDTTRAKHRLTKFLLRRGHRCGARAWTVAWWKWVRALKFEEKADQLILENYVVAVEQGQERRDALEGAIVESSHTEPYEQLVGRLRCFRGIDTVTAMTIVSELHGIERFRSPRQLMAYLGLVPREHSSGARQTRFGITKSGNAHVRRVLGEAAWHYRHWPAVGAELKRRRKGQNLSAIAIADKAMRRLHKRSMAFSYRGVPSQKATTAIARELVGFIWASMMQSRAEQA